MLARRHFKGTLVDVVDLCLETWGPPQKLPPPETQGFDSQPFFKGNQRVNGDNGGSFDGG